MMFSVFDCMTHKRLSDSSYATVEEANHDHYMNAGHTYVGPVRNQGGANAE
jgi:hypothetical protein